MRPLINQFRPGDIANVAAILVMVATMFASLSWISSGRASGQANGLKTASLGFMMLRLEAATQSSNALVQAQSYLTQAGMYYAEADATDDEELKKYLNGLGDQSMEMSEFQTSVAKDSEQKAQSYYENYSEALAKSSEFDKVGALRATAALILNVSATVASGVVLFRRKVLLYVFAPIFFLGLSYLIASLW